MLPDSVRERVTGYIQHQANKSRPAIIDLVETSQERLITLVAPLGDADALRRPEGEHEWCLRELLLHVATAERGVARVIAMLARGEAMPEPDRRVIGGKKEDDGTPFAAIVDDVRAANAEMIAAVRAMPDAPNTDAKFEHPFFGPLNCLEWAVFQRVHDEDHIQHAQRIITTGV